MFAGCVRCLWLRTYFEHVEGFILHHLPLIPQLPHNQLQIVTRVDISCHDLIKRPIEQHLSQQLDRLPLRDITLALNEDVIVPLEEQVEVRADVRRNQLLVFREDEPETIEGIGGDFEGGIIDPVEEFPEDACAGALLRHVDVVEVDRLAVGLRLVVENYSCYCIPFECFFENPSASSGALFFVVPVAEIHYYAWL